MLDIRYYGGKSMPGTILGILLINNTPSFCTLFLSEQYESSNETTYDSLSRIEHFHWSRKTYFLEFLYFPYREYLLINATDNVN